MMCRTGPDHTDPATLTEEDDPNPNPNPYVGRAGGKSMPRCIASGGAGWEVRWLRQQVRCERGQDKGSEGGWGWLIGKGRAGRRGGTGWKGAMAVAAGEVGRE